MPYYHIDPLEIDLRAVTAVMSSEYASRRSILPVEVDGKEVTIATSEPFMSSWEAELSEMLRLNIRRVLSTPADIERYQGEFYNLARSVKRAEAAGVQSSGSRISSSSSSSASPAASSTPTTTTSSISSTGCGSTPSTSARATSTSSRAATWGIIRFRIDGVLHQVYQVPYPVLVAMTSRIKILGAWT
jgi:general secretion pathway protein E